MTRWTPAHEAALKRAKAAQVRPLGPDEADPTMVEEAERIDIPDSPRSHPMTETRIPEQPTLRVRLTRPGAKLPTYATDGASGMDACVVAWASPHVGTKLWIDPGERILCHLGIAAEIPPGYELQVRPRSGLALKHGVVAMLGTIDADYRGEIGATLVNLGDEPYTLTVGDRVCQLVLAPVARAEVVQVEALSESARSTGGYGSTGR